MAERLREDDRSSIDADRATLHLIDGDNLAAMRLLESASVDLIYIDPPYNTGNKFAYADRLGHQAWLAMMRPRLVEARRLLKPTGAIFCSIDDNEVARLRLLLDKVFGEQNFIGSIAVNLNPKGRQLGPWFATSHEHLLVHAREIGRCALDPTTTESVDPADFPLYDEASGRRYRHLPLRNTNKKFNPDTVPTLHYPLHGDPVTGRVAVNEFAGAVPVWPVFGDGTPAVWRWSRPLVESRGEDLVCRRVNGRLGERVDIAQRDWLHEGRRKKLPTIWTAAEVGSTDVGVAEVRSLIGKVFESPKPTGLLRRIVATYPADATVLDFFAGSGSTGHAVAQLNAADGGGRHCVCINSPEPTREGSPARLAGFETVSAITEARLRAVAADLGCGLRVSRLAE
ncbi:site-specific DNA-methyltransferase [Nocardioides limicola]|uniref:site-specific DNA-methyltransferase n=1 Tax=Nocardioides limicola TaxID=2803368 RepID=UPI0027DCC3B5|nr:site-specific DNA-methyltransferase [Nocardioides sp. DJM-14]